MRIILTFCLSIVYCLNISAQEDLHFKNSKHPVKLPFKLINNLIILPVKVNGIELNFLVDTGVEETILFSLDDKKEIQLHDVEKIKLKGLGTREPVEGLKAYKNTLSVANLQFTNQEIVVILDQSFNFSSALGIEVNGIIGYHFFSQAILKMDYEKKKIIIYNPENFIEKKLFKNFQPFDIEIQHAKPYITTEVELNDTIFKAKCLIDSGNSDGLWLFESKSNLVVIPKRNFDDYLGWGFSGAILGKKAKVNTLSLQEFKFQNVISSFPDSVSLTNLKMVDNRIGSVGGEILRRFNVIFDYQNNKMYLKKNKYYKDKFKYNTTGITIHHTGMQWYKEEISLQGIRVEKDNSYKMLGATELKYNFKLLPIYEILNIRENSPAEKSGLKVGDVILNINGNRIYKMNLNKINELLKMDNEKEVTIVVSRCGKEYTFSFKIIDLL